MSRAAAPALISTPELCRVLDALLAAHGGGTTKVAKLGRKASPSCTSSSIEELDITCASGATLQLIFKNVGAEGVLSSAREVKPAFLFDPVREITVYRDVLAALPQGTAQYYGAVVEPAAGRYWLFLERVPGVELFQSGDLADWQQAAQWLARFHCRHRGATAGEGRGHLIRYDHDYYHIWMQRALNFAQRHPGERLSRLVSLASHYSRFVEPLNTMPATIVHGDYHASNILLRVGADKRICPVDWERAGVGPGLVDLAALVAGKWTDAQREALTRAYYDAWGAARPWATFAVMEHALLYCRLHEAVQWLGWAAHWQPPAEHRHDWLDEALQLAAALES